MRNNYKINIYTAGFINIINRNGLTIPGIRGKNIVENFKKYMVHALSTTQQSQVKVKAGRTG
jgi:hypothetical protein